MKFDSPFDISKDGNNPFIDGIRYHIRNSDMIKQECLDKMDEIIVNGNISSLDILEYILDKLGYTFDDLTIEDEHELLSEIKRRFSC